jgi:hypothetical protein
VLRDVACYKGHCLSPHSRILPNQSSEFIMLCFRIP